MKRIIEYVPIITVCLIYFGFCNLHYYYKEFNIDIYNYVSNSEILLSFLPSIVLSASTFYIFIYNKIVNHSNNEEQIEVGVEEEEVKLKWEKIFWTIISSLAFQLLFLLIFENLVRLILIKYFGFKDYDLQILILLRAIIFFILIYFSSELFKSQESINNNLLLISVFLVIYIGTQIGSYRKLDAEKIKRGISNKQISFQYNKKDVATSMQNIYIGQTQSNLFLYNIKSKSTLVYKIENIDSLVVKIENINVSK